ncbi:MAG: CocE/NonD family hydrolase [Pseudomonadota bacterium]
MEILVNRPVRRWLFIAALVAVALCVVKAVYDRRVALKHRYIQSVWTVLNGIERTGGQRLSMRDGVELATDIYLPAGSPPFPTVYVQTIYGRDKWFGGLQAVQWFASEGYAVVIQDVRGRFDSGGTFGVYRSIPSDGVDTLDWISAQPWSNGRVGTFGCSALGEVQYILAAQGHAAHRAMIVESGGGAVGAMDNRHGYFGVYEGGVLNLATAVGWFANYGARDTYHDQRGTVDAALLASTPVSQIVARSGSEPTWYEDFVSHAPGDAWWLGQAFLNEPVTWSLPGLHINQWYDVGVHHSLALAFPKDRVHAAPQRAIVAPAEHCGSEHVRAVDRVGELETRGGNFDYRREYVRFFDQWLKDRGTAAAAALSVFVLNANQWRDFDAWPPPESTPATWFLSSQDGANSPTGDGALRRQPPANGTDRYRYDPEDPVPSRGGAICCTGDPSVGAGPYDQSPLDAREDVLVYQSEPLDSDLTLVGGAVVTLYVETTVADTDFTAKLVEVRDDGSALGIQDGVLRLRYRNGFENPKMATPGTVYPIRITLRDTAYRIGKGSRLRLDISSSNFPRLARNFNTGGAVHSETTGVVAGNSVHFGRDQPSNLTINVLPTRLGDLHAK